MNKNSQKIGGVAAIIQATLYLIGFVFLLTVLAPSMDESLSETDRLVFVLDNTVLIQLWNLLIYVLFGVVLIPLTISINENFNKELFMASKVTPVFGFVWSVLVIASGMIANVGLETVDGMYEDNPEVALNSWKIIESIHNGLGGGIEIVGGVWVLLISLHGLQQYVFTKPLNYLGIFVGITGILTVIPGLSDLGALFGITQIFWFIWIGVTMLKK